MRIQFLLALCLAVLCSCKRKGVKTQIAEIDSAIDAIREELEEYHERLTAIEGGDDEEQMQQYIDAIGLYTDEDGFSYALAFDGQVNGAPVARGLHHVHRYGRNPPWYKHNTTLGVAFWHAGSTLKYHFIYPDGLYKTERLGDPVTDPSASFEVLVPSEAWHTTEVDLAFGSFVLADTVLIPEYTAEVWTRGDADELKVMFPLLEDVIDIAGTWRE